MGTNMRMHLSVRMSVPMSICALIYFQRRGGYRPTSACINKESSDWRHVGTDSGHHAGSP